jgi:carboxymethylenebutenolidase
LTPDAVEVWEAHTGAEFDTSDVDATMATMTQDPVVLHAPTGMGSRGREDVRRFYRDHFVGHQPADLELESLTRTMGTTHLVDEKVVRFTHNADVPWILPGVPATGRQVEIPLVAVVGFEDGLVASEHIYWDQASVLVQVGLLDTAGLPALGSEQARSVLPSGSPAFNTLLRRRRGWGSRRVDRVQDRAVE